MEQVINAACDLCRNSVLGQAQVAAFVFAGADDQVALDGLDGLAAGAAAEHGVQRVLR
ncbi:hypothetical protein [Kibdelosporangium philippinense]|uniref:hypothetical protein n=1 Tax=Kibdelosporangium philippinense TaxID=211113 RepID=UPI0035EE74D4